VNSPGWIKQVLTEDDANSVFCPIRLAGVAALGAHVAFQTLHTVHTFTFDASAFGMGAAAIITATAAGVGIKAKLGA
jgi:hypothetical protein